MWSKPWCMAVEWGHRELCRKAGDDGGETRFWMGLIEKRISDFKKANLQTNIDTTGEVMEETIHGRGEVGREEPLRLLLCEGPE
jgi:hypothetical protein